MSFQTYLAHTVAASGHHLFGSLGRAISSIDNQLSPNEIPSTPELFEMARRGWIKVEVAEKWSAYNGVQLNVSGSNTLDPGKSGLTDLSKLWNQVFWAGQELPTFVETLTLANRGFFTEGGLDRALQRLGYYSATTRGMLANLRFDLPSSSDLVRFSVRHVFEPDLIKYLGYNQEFRPILDMWHRFQGLNYPIFTGPFLDQVQNFEREQGLPPGSFIQSYAEQGLTDPTWAQAFWWSHWVLPSPQQGYQMYFKLNPNIPDKYKPPEAQGVTFSQDDLNLLLRANDYPPKYRAPLAAIARPVPGIRYIRQLRHFDVYTRADVYFLFRRMGYSDKDASDLADTVERNEQEQRGKEKTTKAQKQVLDQWKLGILSDADAEQLLIAFGLPEEETADVFRLAKMEEDTKRIEEVIRAIRSAFVTGRLAEGDARAQLVQLGLQNAWINEHLASWAFVRKEPRKLDSAARARQQACLGLMTIQELHDRLVNLGYSEQDARLLIGEAEVCQAGRAARALAAQQRQKQQQERQLIQQQRQAAQALQQARRALASHGSPAQLRRWYCQGVLGQAELYGRLQFLGWPDIDIARFIASCPKNPGGTAGRRGGPRSIGPGTPSPVGKGP
jgi:hypothetical protein